MGNPGVAVVSHIFDGHLTSHGWGVNHGRPLPPPILLYGSSDLNSTSAVCSVPTVWCPPLHPYGPPTFNTN